MRDVQSINLFRNEKHPLVLAAGDVLFRVGDPGDAMYAVIDGSIHVSVEGVVVERADAGGIVGELSLIDDSPRSATATAAVPTTLARVDKTRFTYLVQEHPTFALMVMSVMADRLRRNTRPIPAM